jgi:hypothetical protein
MESYCLLYLLVGSGNAKFAVLEMSAADKRAQKERLRLMTQQMEDDSQILQAEYGDDYDDQVAKGATPTHFVLPPRACIYVCVAVR